MADEQRIRLVWIDKETFVRDWFHELFGDLIGEEVVEAAWPEPQPHTLYVVDTNWVPLARIPKSFLEAAAKTPSVGFYHNDEWLNEDYSAYRNFSYVVRLHQARGMKRPSILELAMGYPTGAKGNGDYLPISQRTLPWFFGGARVASRPEMLRAMAAVPGGRTHIAGADGRLPHQEYLDLLRNAKFMPAPMGNVIIECGRFYEALEVGAIPIVEKRATIDYYRRLLGPHPVPTFYTWTEAARFMKRMLERPAECDALQRTIMEWWAECRLSWQAKARDFIRRGDSEALREDMRAFPVMSPLQHRFWQYSELLRHQSFGSLTYRIKRAITRRSLARDMSHLDGPRY